MSPDSVQDRNKGQRINPFIKAAAAKPAAETSNSSKITLPTLEIPEIVQRSSLIGFLSPDSPDDPFRPCLVFKIKEQDIAFYRSSKGTANKTEGNWYPFFGLGNKFWLIKGETTQSEIGYGIPALEEIQKELNRAFQGQSAKAVLTLLRHYNQKKLASPGAISEHCYGQAKFPKVNNQDGSSKKHIEDILEKLK